MHTFVSSLYIQSHQPLLLMSVVSEPNIFLDYVATLPPDLTTYLHTKSSSALFLFRLLPTTAQHVIVKLIWNSNVINSLTHEQSRLQIEECVNLLSSLRLINRVDNDYVINSDFRAAYLRGVMHGAQRCSQMTSVDVEEKKRNKDIARKAAERWECILRYLALPSDDNQNSVSVRTRQLFRSAAFTCDSDRDIEITSAGFQFLLLSPVQQMWTYMREYFILEQKEGHDIRELLDLLIRIILCIDKGEDPGRRAFNLEGSWTERQNELIAHMRELGLIFIRKRKDGIFFLTPLLWHLSSGSDAAAGGEERKSGNIIVETNFRLYAYTNSSLQLAILSTFTEMTYRFNDMSVGMLTRESVRRALQVGITAAQIISFLRSNAHPQCLATSGPLNCLPVTVADQTRLWEDERHRLTFSDSTLYYTFETEAEFTGVRDFAIHEGILLWADSDKKLLIVTDEGHSKVKQWWRQHRAH